MIIVKIIGGLGNQMFQYAYAKALEQKGYNVKIDITAFETYKLHGGYQLDKYNINLNQSTHEENNLFHKNNIFSKIFKKIGFSSSNIIKEKNLLFNNNLLTLEDDKYIDGYFQCEKYFENIREVILEQFIIKQEKSDYTKEIENQIITSLNSCSLHIRRGDFINSTNINIHGSCDLDYYNNAINFINKKYVNTKYFIFSDDITWAKENLKIDNVIFIDSKENRLPHEDIYLMSLCSNNIIANSTFSWWGAWLNLNSSKIVIAPKKWFADEKLNEYTKDIICDSWIKI